jgi:hypothetical protein
MSICFKRLIENFGITIKSVKIDKNPFMNDSEFPMDHWKSTLKMGKRQFTTRFSKGSGLKGEEPTIEEILECMQLDISYVDDGYEWFVDSLGYEDTRKTRKMFEQISSDKEKLEKFFGEKFEVFLNAVENEEDEKPEEDEEEPEEES